MSPYCLGTMMFGKLANPDHDECVRVIHKALDSGINFIDTADAYSKGESEEIVGKALKGRRDAVVLATTAFHPMGDDPNQRGSSRRWLTRALENSLRRLQTDHIDLYQVHRPAPDTDIEETLSVLTDLMREGKLRAIGAWTVPASDIVEAQWVAERPRTGAVPHRTAALFHPVPIDRTGGAPHVPALRNGRDGVEPAGERHAHRQVPQGRPAARHASREIFPEWRRWRERPTRHPRSR